MFTLINSIETGWRRLLLLCPLLLAALANAGCDSMNNTQSGALGGGILGGAMGAVLGGVLGGGKGAAIGAGAGAAAGAGLGALSGHAEDKRDEKVQQAVDQANADAAARMLSLPDVVNLVHQHTSDEIIINQIRTSGSVYHLTAADIQYLQSQGVSDAVITEMQATATRPAYYYPRRYYVSDPGAGVVVYPNAPPPVVVGVGIGGYRRW